MTTFEEFFNIYFEARKSIISTKSARTKFEKYRVVFFECAKAQGCDIIFEMLYDENPDLFTTDNFKRFIKRNVVKERLYYANDKLFFVNNILKLKE